MKSFLLLIAWISLWGTAWGAADVPEQLLKLRDPFKRPPLKKISNLPKDELQMYPAEQFKMTGVLTGLQHLRAMIVDPKGKTHFVAEQMHIGEHKGVITQITPSSVKIREQILNVFGKEESVDIELTLPAENKAALDAGSGKVSGGS